MPDKDKQQKQQEPGSHKMPENSFLFDRVIPILLIVLGIITVILIATAIGFLTGIIAWR